MEVVFMMNQVSVNKGCCELLARQCGQHRSVLVLFHVC